MKAEQLWRICKGIRCKWTSDRIKRTLVALVLLRYVAV